jgi:uncharacterized membrane protein YgcG
VQVGTVLTVEITPAQGHRLKANSLKIGTTVILPDASGVYKFSMPWTQADRIGLGAIFEPGTPTTSTSSRTSSRALGVGVGIAVVNHSNQAYINAAPSSVEAGSLDISAESSNISSSAISRSGFTAADLGLAGALTVHVVSGCNSAELNRNLVLSNNGSINLRANVLKSDFITVADAAGTSAGTASGTTPTGSPASDSVGIGAGIAIGVIGVDSYASIADTVSISPASSDTVLDSMNVTASYQGSEQMIAKAGASGGTAIVPVLALDISGIYVAANTGINTADAELTFNNDINVTAFSEMTRSILADAAAVGGGVGFAGSFIVDIINDGAVATLGRSVRGKRVWVKADSVSRVTANGKAGASGGTSQTSNNGQSGGTGSGSGSGSGSGGGGDSGGSDDSEDPGSGDSDEDDPYAGIADLFNEDGENDPPEEDDYSDAFARLFNEGEADAIADANTQAAANLAGVVGTQNVNSNIVNSLTANRQKAETAEGSVQVAATFTLNIQRNVSRAVIADGISVVSEGEIVVESKNDTDGVIISDASATDSTTGVGVAVAINIVTYENIAYVGDARLTGESLTIKAGIYEEEKKDLLDEIISQLLAKLNIDRELVDRLMTELEGTPLQQYLKGKLEALGLTNIDDIAILLRDVIVGRLQAFLKGTDVSDSVEEDLQELVKDTVSKISDGIKDAKVMAEAIKNAASAIINKIKDRQQRQEIITLSLQAIGALLGSNDELDGVGHRISTQTISGVGAANVGVAGSVAISVVMTATFRPTPAWADDTVRAPPMIRALLSDVARISRFPEVRIIVTLSPMEALVSLFWNSMDTEPAMANWLSLPLVDFPIMVPAAAEA